jgi:hypothetical protein
MPRLGMTVHRNFAATQVARVGGRSVRRIYAPGNRRFSVSVESQLLTLCALAALALFAGGAFAFLRVLANLS